MYLSVVIPIRNEEKNIPKLHERLLKVCNELGKEYEIIYVENASTDNSLSVLQSLKKAKTIVLRWQPYMRKAQSLAMDAGFKAAKGKFVIYMDGDLQVEPEEIPKFIEKLEDGFDVVCGWRKNRNDIDDFAIFKPIKLILRKIFTAFRKILIYEGVHDPGSAIKGFKIETLEHIDLYGEMHRFIVAILHWQGFKITEIEVAHHARKYGESKYNVSKGLRGFTDLLSIFFWRKYADRPLHLFGVGGLLITTIGSIFLITLLVLRALRYISLKDSIFPILAVLIIVIGVQLFVSGIIADTLSRIFYSSKKNKTYLVKEIIEN